MSYDTAMKAEDTSPVEMEIGRVEKAASDVMESVHLLLGRLTAVTLPDLTTVGETGVNAVPPDRCAVEIRLAQIRRTLDETVGAVHATLPRLQV